MFLFIFALIASYCADRCHGSSTAWCARTLFESHLLYVVWHFIHHTERSLESPHSTTVFCSVCTFTWSFDLHSGKSWMCSLTQGGCFHFHLLAGKHSFMPTFSKTYLTYRLILLIWLGRQSEYLTSFDPYAVLKQNHKRHCVQKNLNGITKTIWFLLSGWRIKRSCCSRYEGNKVTRNRRREALLVCQEANHGASDPHPVKTFQKLISYSYSPAYLLTVVQSKSIESLRGP